MNRKIRTAWWWAPALAALAASGCAPGASAPRGRSTPPANAREGTARPPGDAPAIPPELWPAGAPAEFAGPDAGQPAADPDALVFDPAPPVGLGPDPDPGPPPTPEPEPSLDRLASDLLRAHNAERAAVGLPPLKASADLMAAADAHARDMADRDAMSHVGSDGSEPQERIARQGYRYITCAENVAGGYRSVEQAIDGWMNSPGHKANILGDFREVGIGLARGSSGMRYWCVTFGRRFVPLDPAVAADEAVRRINQARASEGLAPFRADPILAGAARRHAFAMARKRAIVPHDDVGLPPVERARAAGYRFRRSGLSSGIGEATAEDLVQGWLGDLSTRRYLLGDYNEIGVGYASDPQGTPYWSVIFAEPAG